MNKPEEQLKVREKVLDLTPPPDYKVIYLNDEVTTVDFVVSTLQTTFEYTSDPAVDKAMEINEKGSGVVATLPFEIAEQKGVEVLVAARNEGYPLEVRLEEST
jgi:ATP-dependent Clp protease adaptor protein ClpS